MCIRDRVITDYNVVNGSTTNGANNFVAPATIGGQSTFTVSVANSASGGANSEGVASIKFNAPKSFQRQNRAVIKNDYARTILSEAPDIQAVSVWGGEENTPAVYGKVYLSSISGKYLFSMHEGGDDHWEVVK